MTHDTNANQPLRTVCFFPERAKRKDEEHKRALQTLDYYLRDDLSDWIIVIDK